MSVRTVYRKYEAKLEDFSHCKLHNIDKSLNFKTQKKCISATAKLLFDKNLIYYEIG